LLFPSLAAAAASAEPNAPLASHAYRFEDLPVRSSGPASQRRVLEGETRAGYALELHESEIPAGEAPHPPHRHVHDELVLILEGTVEVTIAGATTRLGPGSVAYFASNDEHGLRNAGATPARYFVVALGRDK
jgi:quercetin dioxygenase-like cupin family protein